MDCESLAGSLTEFLEGRLSASDEAAALDHLASCSRCEVVLAETRDVMQLAREHGVVSLGAPAKSRLRSAMLDADVPNSGSDNRS